MTCISGHLSQNRFPIYPVNDQHKAKACQDTGSCSEGSAGGTEFGMFGIVCRELLDEEPGGANTECGVEYLLVSISLRSRIRNPTELYP